MCSERVAALAKKAGYKMLDQGTAGTPGTRAMGEVGMNRYGFGFPISEQSDEFTTFKLTPARPGRCRRDPQPSGCGCDCSLIFVGREVSLELNCPGLSIACEHPAARDSRGWTGNDSM